MRRLASDAYAAIRDGSLDMALDRMPENEIGMEKCVCFAKELIREKQCILTAPDHPLAQKKNASIMDCREYTMLTGLELLRWKTVSSERHAWSNRISHGKSESSAPDSIDTVMKMVKSGSGIAIGPKSFAEYYGVTAVPLVPARQDSLYFACLKSKKKEPEIREFQRYLTTLVSSVCPD
ncbi:MAG: LysR family transcriptional regulator substrate-binding protein [Coprococcus sp.]